MRTPERRSFWHEGGTTCGCSRGSSWQPSETAISTPAGATTLFVELTSTSATNGTTYYLDAIDATQGGSGGSCTSPVWTDKAANTDYGVEVCNTGGAEGRFNFTNFSIRTSS